MKSVRSTGALLALFITAQPTSAQTQNAIEQAVTAVASEWLRAYNAHDVDAFMATFDEPVGLLIWGRAAPSLDSLRVSVKAVMAQRSNDVWSMDHRTVTVFNDSTAFLQEIETGHYTLPTGVTWECPSGGYMTALMRKRGGAWKIVAMQNHVSGCTQAKE